MSSYEHQLAVDQPVHAAEAGGHLLLLHAQILLPLTLTNLQEIQVSTQSVLLHVQKVSFIFIERVVMFKCTRRLGHTVVFRSNCFPFKMISCHSEPGYGCLFLLKSYYHFYFSIC